ncbi:hypothetical protein ONE63_011102 [Megalurothrips usitatus]|uniref:ABC transporter domain-containing protein n=1 Tax=Megalurothrips usitatus TaxID=439358 RepID=A0AAV7XGZ5_9NEOP|nr:hypothetical protein ONE63_011102 [Megalurothrips usitatus]
MKRSITKCASVLSVPAGNFEAAPEGAIVGVAIENLTKVFGKKKAAVNGLNLNFYQDQINCFLGHNGAGKTTTISMLTGLYTPTSGTARLNGKDIRHDMDAIRTSMGVCPQHNVLFSSLTVEEHLLFFGRIKGVDEKVLKDEIDGMLSEMGLEARNMAPPSLTKNFPKRKLSVGMAFVGGSRTVFLDEPTAGVDPFSRRAIWELLIKYRKGRTVILTTHFMDEADLLGDRIAIISNGRLQCCGSSVNILNSLSIKRHSERVWSVIAKSWGRAGKALLLQEVLSVVPSARPRRVDGADSDDSQVVYTLPDRHDVAAITALLERLDHQRDALGIASYAISDTSLEEIFLKVAEKKESDGSQSDVLALEDDDETTTGKMLAEPVSGGRLLLQQYVSLAVKRFHYVRRDLKGLFTQLVLPAFFVMLALALSPNLNNGSTVEVVMRPDLLGKPVVSFVKQDQGSTTWGAKYLASMLKDGVGTALVGSDDTKKLPSLRSDTVPDHACTNSPPGNSTRDWTLPSGELYYDATGTALEDWLVSTYQNCRKNRFGGVSYGASYPLKGFSKADTVKVWFDGKTAAVSADVPAYLNTINNVILRASLPDGTNTREYGIETSNWPLPDNPDDDKDKVDAFEVVVVLSSAITVIFAMSFVPASFVMYLVEERMGQSKHLQLVSGLRPYIYWLQSYTWDLVSFIVSEFLVILIFVAYQTPMYTSGSNVVALICLIFMYGVSCTPMLYLFSWFFRIPSMAFLVLSTGNLLVGMATTVTIMVMKITSPDSVDVVEGVFLVLPQYCLGQGLMNMAMNHFKTKSMEAMGYEGDSPMTWDVTGKYLVAMAVAAAVLVCAVFLAEQSTHWWHFLQQSSSDEEVKPSDVGGEAEEDVLRERQRVANGEADGGMLVLKRLTKRYKRGAAPAVAGVSLGVERGQCFGLLGLNGAGKTSIFKMLTGDTLISGGDALVDGRSVRGDMDSVRRLTGYCPQFDALIPLLSVREHLVLYSGLRGVEPRQRPAAVRRAIDMLDLGAHEDKQAKALSGGNKRKLSAAIALVGDPLLLYMDEPTTSMDPCARRFVWQRVRRVVAAGRSVLLTSHSMEECEALCSRLTIMVNGRLTCLGSPQHLKHRYGSGYIAIIRCPVARVEEAKSLLLQRLPGGVIVESHLNQVKMQFPPELPLVRIFRSLDETRINGFVSDYSVSQTTLEDVFMRFARAQKAEAT